MSSETTMSREEKEALLNARMEQIRKKNSELQKRYEEVQKDKQNAEAVSETFQETRRSAPPREVISRPKPIRQHERQQQRSSASYPKRSEAQTTTEQPTKINKPRSQRLKEDDGPPPDPSYRFLADKSREREDEIKEEGEQKHNRNQGSRRHPGNYGGRDFDNVKVSLEKRRSYEKASPRHPPRNKMEMTLCMTGRERREYENWRSERNRIEEDRLNRQRTSSGEWRREWDREKDQEKEQNTDMGSQWRSRERVESKEGSRLRGRGSHSESYNLQEGRSSGKSNWRSQDIGDPRYERKLLEMKDDDKLSRKVQINGSESLNISFSNDITPKQEKQRSFSRDSFSSQSEDEWRRGDWHQQTAEKSDPGPRRNVTLLNEEIKGADANTQQQPCLKVVLNLDSVKKELDEEEKCKKLENDEGWEDDEGGSWEDCTTSGNESLVLSELSQEELSDCNLQGNTTDRDFETESFTAKSDSCDVNSSSRFADDSRESNREDKEPTESSPMASDFRDSRESTPTVEQPEIFQTPIEIAKQDSLKMTQVDYATKELQVHDNEVECSRFANENQLHVSQSTFEVADRDSRESTPIVDQSKDNSEISKATIIVVDKQECLETIDPTQQVESVVKDLPVKTPNNEQATDAEQLSASDIVTVASPEVKIESTANDVATKLNDPSVVPQLRDDGTITVAEEPKTDLKLGEDTETMEGEENHAKAPTPKNYE